jgi:hypothetical protein
VAARQAAGDVKVFYVDTAGWPKMPIFLTDFTRTEPAA